MYYVCFDPFKRGYVALEFYWIGFAVTFGQYYVQRVVACDTVQDGIKAFTLGSVLSWVIGAFLVSFLGVAVKG